MAKVLEGLKRSWTTGCSSMGTRMVVGHQKRLEGWEGTRPSQGQLYSRGRVQEVACHSERTVRFSHRGRAAAWNVNNREHRVQQEERHRGVWVTHDSE